MKAIVIWAFVGVFLLAMGSFMMTYTVSFTDAAVLTTFGEAQDGDEIKPGLHFKWPSPAQSVTTYDKRLRIVETRLETQQTSDSRPIIIETYCLWRVVDANAFYQRYSNAGDRADQHLAEADRIIDSRMRSAITLVGRYALTDLFPEEGTDSALDELEGRILAAVRSTAGQDTDPTAGAISDGGIEVVQVGISMLLLPEEVTGAIVDRMRESRNRATRELEASGKDRATTITSAAQEDKKRILRFAELIATEERNLGEKEAAKFLKNIGNTELALFLQQLDFMRNDLAARGATLIMPLDMTGFRLLDPRILNEAIRTGDIPSIEAEPETTATNADTNDTSDGGAD